MRITIKLDAFNQDADSAYAVLWLDKERGRWSREAHERIELPSWGTCEFTQGGMLLRGPGTSAAVAMLEGLGLAAREAAFGTPELMTAQRGRAVVCGYGESNASHVKNAGYWHIQCVDTETTIPEHEIFSDEPDVSREGSTQVRDSGSLAT
ncbi:DUF3564 family protein (plasmid) [Caballeronia sp. NK8]|uniref:DUF3564 family protein n=1 Tax=Caballeronia sp. NK8 TaxID=140098 RepID=UPI001BB4ECEA|nr:DUF3564 family protein [Caballeronia sp. NK8]BCQ28990.1 DUF3564 family protein [Caballeronia sp. NK8]